MGERGETDNVTKEALTGTARVKNVTILDQTWCDDRLKQLRIGAEEPGPEYGFEVFPKSDFTRTQGRVRFTRVYLQSLLRCS